MAIIILTYYIWSEPVLGPGVLDKMSAVMGTQLRQLVRTQLAARQAVAWLAVMLAVPVAAHHSYAEFDMSQFMLIEGRVTVWQLQNPHSLLEVEAVDENGDLQTWRFEGASRVLALRSGIWDETFVPGELIKVVVNPVRTGERAGAMCFGIKADQWILPLHDGTCNPATVVEIWQSQGWFDTTRHLESRPATPGS